MTKSAWIARRITMTLLSIINGIMKTLTRLIRCLPRPMLPRHKQNAWRRILIKSILLFGSVVVILQYTLLCLTTDSNSDKKSYKGFDPSQMSQQEMLKFDKCPSNSLKRYLTGRLRNVSHDLLEKPLKYKEFADLSLASFNLSLHQSEVMTNGDRQNHVDFIWNEAATFLMAQAQSVQIEHNQNNKNKDSNSHLINSIVPNKRTTVKLKSDVDSMQVKDPIESVKNTNHLVNDNKPFKGAPSETDTENLAPRSKRTISLNRSADSTIHSSNVSQSLLLRNSFGDKDRLTKARPTVRTNGVKQKIISENDHRPDNGYNLCPLDYPMTTCSLMFLADASIKVKFDRPARLGHFLENVRRGHIAINGQVVHSWETKNENLFIVRLDDKCKITERLNFAVNTKKSHAIAGSMATQYLKQMSPKTVFAGIAYGNTNLMIKDQLPADERKYTSSREFSVTPFVLFRDYAGLSWKEIESGRDYVNDTKEFHFGHEFKMTTDNKTYEDVLQIHPDVGHGGHWRPTDCQPRSRIAIIVPFRNRERHLALFLLNMIQFLKLQHIEHQIFVVEQTGPELFNRATLMNVGYLEAKKADFDCYVFHDVDQIPEDLSNWYHCSSGPRHLVASRSYTSYQLRFPNYFGGAISLTSDLIEEMNGFANRWYGWGGEDDDMYGRLLHNNHTLQRLPPEIGRYYSLEHDREEPTNPHIKSKSGPEILKESPSFMDTDGLNTLEVTELHVTLRELYTHVYVRIPGPKTMAEEWKNRWPDLPVPSSTAPLTNSAWLLAIFVTFSIILFLQ